MTFIDIALFLRCYEPEFRVHSMRSPFRRDEVTGEDGTGTTIANKRVEGGVISFLKSLLGRLRNDHFTAEGSSSKQGGDNEPDWAFGIKRDFSLPSQEYCAELQRIVTAISAADYVTAASAARASLPLLREWLRDPRADGERLQLRVPALSQGGTMMAITGDQVGLEKLRQLVHEFEYLESYREEANQHFVTLQLFQRIRQVVRDNPGVLQNCMKFELGIEDGRLASRLILYLEKFGEIRRVQSGKTYGLYPANFDLPDEAVAAAYCEPPKPRLHSHEINTTDPRQLNFNHLTIVRLPPSPPAWERPVSLPATEKAFEDSGQAWSKIVVEPIATHNRPDPAFRRHYSTRNGALSFDDLAKSEASAMAAGAVMFSDKAGRQKSVAPLARDAYQISVHPEGEGFATRSKSSVLTVYGPDLQVDFETDLDSAPEAAACASNSLSLPVWPSRGCWPRKSAPRR